jgi:hypothetical protein
MDCNRRATHRGQLEKGSVLIRKLHLNTTSIHNHICLPFQTICFRRCHLPFYRKGVVSTGTRKRLGSPEIESWRGEFSVLSRTTPEPPQFPVQRVTGLYRG